MWLDSVMLKASANMKNRYILPHYSCIVIHIVSPDSLSLFYIKHLYLWLQLEQLESELTADRESLRSAESLSTDLMKEKALLEKTLETLRENSERQVHTHTQ